MQKQMLDDDDSEYSAVDQEIDEPVEIVEEGAARVNSGSPKPNKQVAEATGAGVIEGQIDGAISIDDDDDVEDDYDDDDEENFPDASGVASMTSG